MKELTTEQQTIVKQALAKKWNVSEGIIEKIFKIGLARQIKGDPQFKKLATDLDDAFARMKAAAQERERQGRRVPDAWKHLLEK